MSYKKTKEPHRLTLKADWMVANTKDRMVHEELLVLLRIFLVVLAETWTQAQGVNLPRVRKRKAHEEKPKKIRFSKEKQLTIIT